MSPAENAPIVGSLYLADVHGRRCRRLTAEDLATAPFAAEEPRKGHEMRARTSSRRARES